MTDLDLFKKNKDLSEEVKKLVLLKCKEQDRNTRHDAIETLLSVVEKYQKEGKDLKDIPMDFISELGKELMNQKLRLPEL